MLQHKRKNHRQRGNTAWTNLINSKFNHSTPRKDLWRNFQKIIKREKPSKHQKTLHVNQLDYHDPDKLSEILADHFENNSQREKTISSPQDNSHSINTTTISNIIKI